jgi:hypothetical protein
VPRVPGPPASHQRPAPYQYRIKGDGVQRGMHWGEMLRYWQGWRTRAMWQMPVCCAVGGASSTRPASQLLAPTHYASYVNGDTQTQSCLLCK